MSLHDNLARIRQSDVDALTAASINLVEAAATIASSKAAWASPVIQLLRSANETILAVRDRGLARITRYLAKLEDRVDAEARKNSTAVVEMAGPGDAPAGWPRRKSDA